MLNVTSYQAKNSFTSALDFKLEDSSFYCLIVQGLITKDFGAFAILSTSGGYAYKSEVYNSGVTIGHAGLTLTIDPKGTFARAQRDENYINHRFSIVVDYLYTYAGYIGR